MNYLDGVNIGYKRNEKYGIIYYTVPAFEKYVNFAFCGDSNLTFKAVRGATTDQVQDSYKKLCSILDMPYEACVMTNIVHGNTVTEIDKIHKGYGVSSAVKLPPCDGLITNKASIPIASTHADCMPIAFFDKANKVGCVVHAGWRGILAGIQKRAVEVFTKNYGSDVKNLLAAVGPAIQKCCFEVDKDITASFKEAYLRDDFIALSRNKDKLDLQKIVINSLREFNIPAKNITVDGRCTACKDSSFTSYRRDKDGAGTMVQMMCLK